MASELMDVPTRMTLGHYADQILAGIQRANGLLDKLDGGRPEGADTEKPVESLMSDLARAGSLLEDVNQRLAGIVERTGRIL